LTRPDLDRDMFQRALELDAGYEPAWAGLATVNATLYEWFGSQAEDLAQAEHASRRASGRGWPRRTSREGVRCRYRGAMKMPRANSEKPSVSIPTCSTPTTTSLEPALPPAICTLGRALSPGR
jgi:hypothetical protein